jgi:hypothetical protein
MTDYTTIARPAHVIQEPRYIVLFWPVEGAPVDEHGHSLHNTLTFEHEAKTFRAVESTALASIPGDGTISIDLQIANRPRRTVLKSEPAARWSAPRFKAFVQSVLG